MNYGKENAVSVGPWTVFSEVVSEGKDDLQEQKAVSSMCTLFDGRISYYLKSPVTYENNKVLPKPLVFIKEFTRQTRPRAWKQMDLKIQSTLPLLGNDEAALHEMAAGALRLLVKISLELEGEATKCVSCTDLSNGRIEDERKDRSKETFPSC